MKRPADILKRYLIEALELKLHVEILKDPGRRQSFERAAARLGERLGAGSKAKPGGSKKSPSKRRRRIAGG